MRLSRRGKRRLTLVIAMVLAVVLAAVAFKTVRRAQQARLFADARADGMAAYREGDMDTAIERLSYFIQDDKSDVGVLLAFGDARAQVPMPDRRHVSDAVGLYKHALTVLDADPDHPDRAAATREALVHLVDLYGMLGMSFERVEAADRLLEEDPADLHALSARAYARIRMRELDAALADARRLGELEPDNVAWRQLELEIMRRSGRGPDEMVDRIEAWLADGATDGRYQVLQAGLLAAGGRIDDAKSLMTEAADRGASTIEVLEMMVQMLDELQLRDVAARVIEDAKRNFPDEPWVREAMVRRYWQALHLGEAMDELEAAKREFPSSSVGLLQLEALLLVASGRVDEVPAVLERLLRAARGGESEEAVVAWTRAVHARLRLDERSWADAMRQIDHALTLQPDAAALYMIKGEAFAAVGEMTQATEAFGQAFDRDRNWIAAGLTYAQALLQVGRADEAFIVARHVLYRTGRSMLLPFLVYARAYLAALESGSHPQLTTALTGISGNVGDLYREIYAQVPDRPEVAALLAEVDVRAGRRGEAIAFMDDVVAQETPAPEALMALARVSRDHELGRERALLERARAVAGLTVPIAFALADLEAEAGRHDRGLALVDEAIATADDETKASVAVRQARVRYLLQMGHPDAQRELHEFAAAFEASPSAQSFVLSLPATWEDRALVEQSIERLRTVLGERSQRASLARAQYLVRFHADEEARLAEAIRLLNDVLDRSPDSLAALTLMAEASMLGERPSPQRASSSLEAAIDVAPGQVQLYPRLISLLQQQGDYEDAGQYLQRLSALEVRDERVQRTELQLLQQQGDFEAALVRATSLFGESSEEVDQLVLAAMHRRAGDLERAEAIYDELLSRPDRSPTTVAAAAGLLAETGRDAEGLTLLQSLPEQGAHRDLLVGRYLRQHGDPVAARAALERAVAAETGSAEARIELARLHLAQGDADRAADVAMEGLRASPEDATLRGLLAMTQLARGGSGAADAARALRAVPGVDEDLLAMLGLVEELSRDGSLDAPTDDDLRRARELTEEHGGLPAVWMLACRLHVAGGRYDTAITLARRAISRFPADPGTARLATELLLGAGRWDEALIEAEQWRRRSLEDTLAADVVIARLLGQLGRPDEALAQLDAHRRRIEAQARREPDPMAVLLQSLLAAGRIDEAMTLAGSLLSDDAAWRSRWIGIALTLPVDTAARTLAGLPSSVTDAGEQLSIASAWNQVALRSGAPADLDRAAEWAERAASSSDRALDAAVMQGTIAETAGQLQRAEMLYRSVLARVPDHAFALNNLAFVLASQGRGEEALDLAQRALAAQPDQPDVLDTYAHALLAVGRAGDAAEAVRQALVQRPDDPAIMLTMVEALMESGQLDQADERLGRAAALLRASSLARRDQIERADELRRRLDGERSAVAPRDAASRVTEASPVGAGGS